MGAYRRSSVRGSRDLPWLCRLGAALALLLAAWPTGPPRADGPEVLGRFALTTYHVVQEGAAAPAGEDGRWPLYAPECAGVIAFTTRAFHDRLSLEGTGLLSDGRLVNFEEYCPCARPGHEGTRTCYAVLDRQRFPWGRGARLGERFLALAPFRSVAVDPERIPIGTPLYLPELRGRLRPDGGTLDGCFRAEDVGRLIRGSRIDLFAGTSAWARAFRRANPIRTVTVVRGEPRCAGLGD